MTNKTPKSNSIPCETVSPTFIVADEKQEEKEDSLDEKKQPAKPESKKAAKPVIEIKEFKDWTTNKDQKDVRTRLMLPDTVIMTLKLSNPSNTRERSFTFRVPVAARFHEVPIQEPPKTVPGLADKPAAGKSDEDKSLADTSKKEVFVENANKIVQNLRTKFGRA